MGPTWGIGSAERIWGNVTQPIVHVLCPARCCSTYRESTSIISASLSAYMNDAILYMFSLGGDGVQPAQAEPVSGINPHQCFTVAHYRGDSDRAEKPRPHFTHSLLPVCSGDSEDPCMDFQPWGLCWCEPACRWRPSAPWTWECNNKKSIYIVLFTKESKDLGGNTHIKANKL